MAMLASQGVDVYGSATPSQGNISKSKTLTPKQKKVRKANKKAGKSRAKNRRK